MTTYMKLGAVLSELQLLTHNATNPPDPLSCFDLLSNLVTSITNEPKDSLLALQRRCEDTLQQLIILGSPPPIRRLIGSSFVTLIEVGDAISIYARVGSLQGLLNEKGLKPLTILGAAHCLGALSLHHGSKILSSLPETVNIASRLIRSQEPGVKLAAIQLLHDALHGAKGSGSWSAYREAVKSVTRYGVSDKLPLVREKAGHCLEAVATIGGPGISGGGIEPVASLCLKSLEDSVQSVRDSFASALGALVALGLNPQAQIQPRGKGAQIPAKSIEGGLSKFLASPFSRASGPKARDIRVGLAAAWVAFLQNMRLNYGLTDANLIPYSQAAISMLSSPPKPLTDAHSQACTLYIIQVGIVEQLGESAQRDLISPLLQQLTAADATSGTLTVSLRSLSHILKTLGEVTPELSEAVKASLLSCLNHSSPQVRLETALAIQALGEVDSSCVQPLLQSGVQSLKSVTEVTAGADKNVELPSIHGHSAMVAALLVIAPSLTLGIPSTLPLNLLDLAQQMTLSPRSSHPARVAEEREAGWILAATLFRSLPKEVIKSRELEFVAMWTPNFGPSCVERLKKIDSSHLAMEISGLTAAMDALRSFIVCYIIPNSEGAKSPTLQSALSFLRGGLRCITAPILSEAAVSLRPLVEMLVAFTLRSYSALPDCRMYKADHATLLSICTSPFSDGTAFPASSLLRQALDPRDSSLGPWIPGRDDLEDELRAFGGGSDTVLPSFWDSTKPSLFPQPISQVTFLVDSMLLCLCSVFVAQPEQTRVQLLGVIINCLKSNRKPVWKTNNAINACVVLLGTLKAMLADKSAEKKPSSELWKTFQLVVQGVLAADPSDPAYRRTAAEALGLLARLADDTYTARLVRSLLSDANGTSDSYQKSAIALALGVVRLSVGGMALSTLVGPSVQILSSFARDHTDGLHVWSLHAIWLIAEAAGLAYIPHVQATLSLSMEVLLSEDHCSSPQLFQTVGRLVNAIVAVLGPELVPGSSVFTRCKSILSDISSTTHPSAQLECVLYTQQLVLFAPQAAPIHVNVETLRATLSSRQPALRQAAISTLRHLSEREPAAMCDEMLEEDLFAMLDSETNERIVLDVCLTLERLLEAACPTNPGRWLRLCRNVVLAAAATREAGKEESDKDGLGHELGQAEDDEAGMVSSSQAREGKPDSENQWEANLCHLPRFRTRIFAAQCLSRLPNSTGSNPAHFDMALAHQSDQKEQRDGRGDWLVYHLGELVALAYQVATGNLEVVRPLGVKLLSTVLAKFGSTQDPEYAGHLLLEQYQAQFLSTVRSAFEGGPLLIIAGAKLAAEIVTSGLAGGERAILQRVMALISKPLASWHELSYDTYAEWVGCSVRLELLAAHAKVKCFALSGIEEPHSPLPRQPSQRDAKALSSIIRNSSHQVTRYWLGVLRDFSVKESGDEDRQVGYKPFLVLSSASQPGFPSSLAYMTSGWALFLEAVSRDAKPRASNHPQGDLPAGDQEGLSSAEFAQIWGLALLMMCKEEKEDESEAWKNGEGEGEVPTMGREDQLIVALRALRELTAPHFYRPEYTSVELCIELVEVLLDISVQVSRSPRVLAPALALLDQVVSCSPPSFWQNKNMAFACSEILLALLHKLLGSDPGVGAHVALLSPADEASVVAILRTLGALASSLDSQTVHLLVPHFLCACLKALRLPSVAGPALSSASELTCLLASLGAQGESGINLGLADMRASYLSSCVESLAREVDGILNPTESGSFVVVESPKVQRSSFHDATDLTLRRGSWDPKPSPPYQQQRSASFPAFSKVESLPSSQPEGVEKDLEIEKRLPVLLSTMLTICPSIPHIPAVDTGEQLRNRSWSRTLKCMQSALLSPVSSVQVSTFQSLQNVMRKWDLKSAHASQREWILQAVKVVAATNAALIHSTIRLESWAGDTVTSAMECLKLFLLMHAILDGEKCQLAILQMLLQAAIALTACADSTTSYPTLASFLIRLVQNLASSAPAQLQAVTASLHPDLKAQLQAAIRSSTAAAAASQRSRQAAISSPQAPAASKQVVSLGRLPPPASSTLLPPPTALPPPPQVTTLTQQHDDDDDDEWDNFQSERATSVTASIPPANDNTSVQHESEEDDWDDFQESDQPTAVAGSESLPSDGHPQPESDDSSTATEDPGFPQAALETETAPDQPADRVLVLGVVMIEDGDGDVSEVALEEVDHSVPSKTAIAEDAIGDDSEVALEEVDHSVSAKMAIAEDAIGDVSEFALEEVDHSVSVKTAIANKTLEVGLPDKTTGAPGDEQRIVVADEASESTREISAPNVLFAEDVLSNSMDKSESGVAIVVLRNENDHTADQNMVLDASPEDSESLHHV